MPGCELAIREIRHLLFMFAAITATIGLAVTSAALAVPGSALETVLPGLAQRTRNRSQ